MQNHAKVFTCELCDFSCSNRSNWKTHTLTSKHKQVTKCDVSVTPKNATFTKTINLLYPSKVKR